MKTNSPQNSGFTLVELLFACALIGLMLTITLQTFIGVFRFYNWAKVTRTNQQSARALMDNLTREIRGRNIVSTTPDRVCLGDTSSKIIVGGIVVKSVAIYFAEDNGRGVVRRDYYEQNSCSEPSLLTSALSSSNVSIVDGSFEKIAGVVGVTPSESTKQSIQIRLSTLNGQRNTATGICDTADNFCDLSVFTTVVTEK